MGFAHWSGFLASPAYEILLTNMNGRYETMLGHAIHSVVRFFTCSSFTSYKPELVMWTGRHRFQDDTELVAQYPPGATRPTS
jgi:hypothetical protein